MVSSVPPAVQKPHLQWSFQLIGPLQISVVVCILQIVCQCSHAAPKYAFLGRLWCLDKKVINSNVSPIIAASCLPTCFFFYKQNSKSKAQRLMSLLYLSSCPVTTILHSPETTLLVA